MKTGYIYALKFKPNNFKIDSDGQMNPFLILNL